MPNPKRSENKQDFLKRCTSELIENEGRKSDQAFAMCNSFWDDSKNERPIMELSAPVELAKEDGGKTKEFMITAYTGKPFDTWFGKIVFDIAGMKTKKKMPILREHARDRIVGFGQSFKNDEKTELYVGGEFSQITEDAKEVYDLAQEGYPWQASVAVWARKVKVLDDDKQSMVVNGQELVGPAEVWTESDVGEVSFVTLGRDDNTAAITLNEKAERTAVVIECEDGDNEQNQESEDLTIMDFTIESLKKNAPELLAQIEDDAFEAGRAQGAEDERMRVIELLEAEADENETRAAIESGMDAAEAYKKFYKAEKSKRAQGLIELEQQATDPQGSEEPVDEQPKPMKTEEEMRREWRPTMGPAAGNA